jgi:hypothetical protein
MMRIRAKKSAKFLICAMACLCVVPLSLSAQKAGSKPNQAATSSEATSPDKTEAMAMLRSLADDLRRESSDPEALSLQGEIADVVWAFDEDYARMVFRRAFAVASEPVTNLSTVDTKLRQQQLDVARRKAGALARILRLLAKHDEATATQWLEKYESDKVDSEKKEKNSQAQSELLAQLALDVSERNPQQAQRLGLASLGFGDVPEAIGRLLFALAKHGKQYSDPIFFATLENLRRNGYRYNNVLGSVCNYVFFNDGTFSKEYGNQAAAVITFLIDAAEVHRAEWRQSRIAGAQSLSSSAASFHFFFLTKGIPIIKANMPDKVPTLQALVEEFSTGLTHQQLGEAGALARSIYQQRTLNEVSGNALDDQLRYAASEKDPVIRDNLWRRVATNIMRGEPDRALSIAASIEDLGLRKQTEDDIRLLITAAKIKLRDYLEARKVALQLNDFGLRARTLGAIAMANKAGPVLCDAELLAEAYAVALKDENRPEKVRVILKLASYFPKCGAERGFEVLSAAIEVANKLRSESFANPPILRYRIVNYTMVGGQELTTEVSTTRDSIVFDDITGFVRLDFAQAQNLGLQFKDPVLRAKYLITIARTVLLTSPKQSARNPD